LPPCLFHLMSSLFHKLIPTNECQRKNDQTMKKVFFPKKSSKKVVIPRCIRMAGVEKIILWMSKVLIHILFLILISHKFKSLLWLCPVYRNKCKRVDTQCIFNLSIVYINVYLCCGFVLSLEINVKRLIHNVFLI